MWSPDGQFIAYVTWNDDDGGRIYRVRADGNGQPERLTPVAAFYDKLAYSRDGSRLIGVRGSKMHRLRTLEDFGSHSGSAELEYIWLPANGGTISRIAWEAGGSTQEGREAPHVGPDPDRVYIWADSDASSPNPWRTVATSLVATSRTSSLFAARPFALATTLPVTDCDALSATP